MVNMQSIAAELGISRTTVSFILNGRHKEMKISEELAHQVLDTAYNMGYVHNKLAKAVVTGKNNVIAIIAHLSDYFMRTMQGCIDEAAKHDCLIKLIPFEYDINKALRQAVEYRVAGIFISSLTESEALQIDRKLLSYKIPVIGLTQESGRMSFNQKASAMQGTEFLISEGYRKIFFCCTLSHLSRERSEGYISVMRKYGFDPHIEIYDDLYELHYEKWLAAKPDAFQFASDTPALLFMQYCYRKKIRIPDEFGILGFGNLTAGAYTSPALSSVDEPYYETGQIMFQRIYHLIQTGKEPCFPLLVGDVIARESTVKKHKHNGG